MIPVQMRVSVEPVALPMSVSGTSPIAVEIGSEYRTYDSYHGAYSVDPDTTEQVLPTAGKLMNQNIVVAPIPQNYGLITWNGSYLIVS
jgi:hypothetical protein